MHYQNMMVVSMSGPLDSDFIITGLISKRKLTYLLLSIMLISLFLTLHILLYDSTIYSIQVREKWQRKLTQKVPTQKIFMTFSIVGSNNYFKQQKFTNKTHNLAANENSTKVVSTSHSFPKNKSKAATSLDNWRPKGSALNTCALKKSFSHKIFIPFHHISAERARY